MWPIYSRGFALLNNVVSSSWKVLLLNNIWSITFLIFFFFFGLTITFLIFYKFCNINLYYNAPWSDNKGGQWREILFLLRRFTLNKPTSHSFKHNCPIFGALATVLPCLSICSYVFFSFNLQCLFNKYIFLFKKINHYETNT